MTLSNLLGLYFLYKAVLYVSLKPCHMCEEVIKESRIRNVYYYLENSKSIYYTKIDNEKITITF